ncbi:MAG: hypothetical protein HY862_16080 [Chloroflexi bacterium]|nr:hypothetical protein [Chloroflexota bacterium]
MPISGVVRRPNLILEVIGVSVIDLHKLYIDKTNQTFADGLLAYGMARVVWELLDDQTGNQSQADVTLIDKGSYFELRLHPTLVEATIPNRKHVLWPANIIRTLKNIDELPSELQTDRFSISYEAKREAIDLFFAAKKKGGDAPPPDPHWDIYRAINPASLPGYNGLLLDWWTIREAQPEALWILLNLFSQTPNDIDGAMEEWRRLDKTHGWGIKPDATCQQLYNPDQGKGQNKTKANGLSIGNTSQFWLLEWLKAVGFYEVALTRQVRGAKDRKTFVVAPRELSYSEHREIMSSFRNTMQVSESATKFDILAAVRYTQALLGYFGESTTRMASLKRRGNVKKRVVAGFQTAFYKDLGNAVATMNVAFIGLPGWVEAASVESIGIYQGLLKELEQVTYQFDESHSDAFNLLQHLRNFVSGDDLSAFFRFTNAYPAYVMSRRGGRSAFLFSTSFIERLIMETEKKLTEILQSQGFRNIAYAIRQSTVIAQYWSTKEKTYPYDIRYGLGQELARKARHKTDFVAVLSDFLQKYDAENAQILERMEKRGIKAPFRFQRKSIETSDIEEIVWLIERHGSQAVANLLIAYGYARVPREDETPEELEATQE